MSKIKKYLESIYNKSVNNIFLSGRTGYWHNLSKTENDQFFKILEKNDCKTAVKSFMPKFEEMIFSSKREAGLELLDHNKQGVCIDYGSMWGVLSVGMAKRGHQVIAVDQTHDSLKFLNSRCTEEGLENIHLVQDDIRKVKFKNIADYAIVNGVLEWIPEKSEVIVEEYLDNKNSKLKNSTNPSTLDNPRDMQINFLKKVYQSLNMGGQLFLAIENKLNYAYLMGRSDPHVNLKFTTFLPRSISNIISRIFKKKDYRTYIYSFAELKDLLKEAGFQQIEDYCCFPMYHFPSLVFPNSREGINQYIAYKDKNVVTWKQKLVFKYFEIFLMKYLKARNFCPAIMIVAKK
jgi:ubiquinone/menaquinone biosynthesis C-methylase UbiE